MRLVPCPHCACHVAVDSCRCAHCGETVHECGSATVRSAAAVLLGLTIAVGACATSQPVYDAPTYDSLDTLTDSAEDTATPLPTGDTGTT